MRIIAVVSEEARFFMKVPRCADFVTRDGVASSLLRSSLSLTFSSSCSLFLVSRRSRDKSAVEQSITVFSNC